MQRWLQYLSTIAVDVAPVGHAKIAACIVYKDELISVGICSYKTHPLQRKYGRNSSSIHLHAEINALIKAQSRVKARGISLKKCTMYVARVKKPFAQATTFVSGLACPCEGCARALRDAGITNVIYTEG